MGSDRQIKTESYKASKALKLDIFVSSCLPVRTRTYYFTNFCCSDKLCGY